MCCTLADVMILREKENRAVNPAMAPRRPGIVCIAYKTAIPATGRREAMMTDNVLRTRNIPSSEYLMVFCV